MSAPSNAPIFVVGCPRSGTSLFRDLLRHHPRLSFPPETQFIVRLYRHFGDPRSDREARFLARTILRLSWIRRWKLDLEPAQFVHCRSFAQILNVLFGAWAAREGKPRWGDKTPQYVASIPVLLTMYPNAKVIHCYRDGRDVALSWCRAWFGPSNIVSAALRWKYFVKTGRSIGLALGPHQYLEVRYEALLKDPQPTMQSVYAFLGETDLSGDLKLNYLRKEVHKPRFGSAQTTVISDTEIVGSNRELWRKRMSTKDRQRFESVAGDLLETLGYEVGPPRTPPSPLVTQFWRVHSLLGMSLAQLNSQTLPRRVFNEVLYRRALWYRRISRSLP